MESERISIRGAEHGLQVLVVDDDALARRSLRAMLERAHYQVETAGSGEEALAILSSHRVDLVLLDILMPGMDGLETCRRIRAQQNDRDLLPIIFVTGDERPGIHSEALRARGDDFLRKPVVSAELLIRIQSLIRLKHLQAEIVAERDALLDLQRQREQLIHFIVHDLKNPLTVLQLGIDFLGDHIVDMPAAQARTQRLKETVRYMGRMIQDILDIGRAEQMGLELKKTLINLGPWLHSLLKEVEGQAEHRKHRFLLDCTENLVVEADPDLLRRTFLNLVENALKYSPPDSETRIEVGRGKNGIRLVVVDQGYGIPEHLHEKVFELFVCLEAEAGGRSSSGLGLAFCRMVAEAHRGRIWVENNHPKGSQFFLELPEVE